MYLEHFGLTRFPFSIAPDPDFLFPTQGHQEALAHLHYAFTGMSGLMCLTGEVGTGKTTLCRTFINAAPDSVHIAYIFNPQLSPVELLQAICDELGLSYPADASLKSLYQILNHRLLELYSQGDKVICVIDEAQVMPAPLLEQIRLLTNLETSKEKLLSLILVGQPELNELLSRHDLRQLNQRITARFHLKHLTLAEARDYARYRVRQAGSEQDLFHDKAIAYLWKVSQGVPRILNTLCDRALLGAYAQGRDQVDLGLAKGAEQEVLPGSGASQASAGLNQNHNHNQIRATSGTQRPGFFTVFLAVLLGVILGAGTLLAVNTPSNQKLSLDTVVDLFQPAAATPDTPLALLTQHWSQPVPRCEQLSVDEPQCLWVDWSLSSLQRLGLPVVIKQQVYGSDAAPQWQLIEQFSARQGKYLNEALVLWQVPQGYEGIIRPGEQSDVIFWVREQLGSAWGADWQVIAPSGSSAIPRSNVYDPILAQQVFDFQQQQGLKADKILGPRTLIALQQQEEQQQDKLQKDKLPGSAGEGR